MSSLGRILKRLMDDKHVSENELSSKLDLDVSVINGWLMNEREVDKDYLPKIGEIFNVNIDDYIIGSTVRISREILDLKESTLAPELGITPQLLGQWEKGIKPISLNYLALLSARLGLRIDDLINGSIDNENMFYNKYYFKRKYFNGNKIKSIKSIENKLDLVDNYTKSYNDLRNEITKLYFGKQYNNYLIIYLLKLFEVKYKNNILTLDRLIQANYKNNLLEVINSMEFGLRLDIFKIANGNYRIIGKYIRSFSAEVQRKLLLEAYNSHLKRDEMYLLVRDILD